MTWDRPNRDTSARDRPQRRRTIPGLADISDPPQYL